MSSVDFSVRQMRRSELDALENNQAAIALTSNTKWKKFLAVRKCITDRTDII